MAVCDDAKVGPGKLVTVGWAGNICGDADFLLATYLPLGTINTKQLTSAAQMADGVNDQSGVYTDEDVVRLSMELTVSGFSTSVDTAQSVQNALVMYYHAEVQAGRQPTGWLKVSGPSLPRIYYIYVNCKGVDEGFNTDDNSTISFTFGVRGTGDATISPVQLIAVTQVLTAYGHVKIEWGDRAFNLSPSFVNIAKIGNPKEIIDTFKDFIASNNLIVKFAIALNVLECCSDKEIPRALTGGVKFSERQQKFMLVNPEHGEAMIRDVIILAEHCLIHGVCGKVESKGKGEPVTEFDAYSFMELARIHLNLSLDDASKMTMTEFLRLMDAKFPPEKNEDEASPEEEADLLAWFTSTNKAH